MNLFQRLALAAALSVPAIAQVTLSTINASDPVVATSLPEINANFTALNQKQLVISGAPSGSCTSASVGTIAGRSDVFATPLYMCGQTSSSLYGWINIGIGVLPSGTANLFVATPNGSSGVSALRAIVAADIPTLNQNTTGSAASVTGFTAGGGTLTGPATGGTVTTTPGANAIAQAGGGGTLAAGFIPTLNQNTTGSAGSATTASQVNGGAVPASQPCVGTNSSSQLITGTCGGALPSGTANLFVATPNGSSGISALRAIVAADIPTLNQNTTGSAGSVAGFINSLDTCIDASGSTTAYVCTSAQGQATTNGKAFLVKPQTTNTASATLTINSTIWTLKKQGNNLVAGDFIGGQWYLAASDGSFWNVVSRLGTDGSGVLPSGTANLVVATPNGSSGISALRAIVAADIPTLNQNTTGSAGSATTATQVNGAIVPASQACVGTNSSRQIVSASCTGSGGTGNAASVVTTTFSATPTFTCPSSSAGTVTSFELSTALSANITGSTLSGCTAGQTLNFAFQQASSGGPYTVVMPTGFDSINIAGLAGSFTTASYLWDGTVGHLTGSSGAGSNGTGSSAVILPELAINGTSYIGIFGQDMIAGSYSLCLPRVVSTFGQTLMDSGNTVLTTLPNGGGAGPTCRISYFQQSTPTLSTTVTWTSGAYAAQTTDLTTQLNATSTGAINLGQCGGLGGGSFAPLSAPLWMDDSAGVLTVNALGGSFFIGTGFSGATIGSSVATLTGAAGQGIMVACDGTNWQTTSYAPAIGGSGGAVSSLTTTGSSGAATLSSGVLNIPVYTGGGSNPYVTAFGTCEGAPNPAGGIAIINLGGNVGSGACAGGASDFFGFTVPVSGLHLIAFVIKSSVNGGVATDGIMTVHDNASATAATCTIGTSANSCTWTGSIAVSALDQLWVNMGAVTGGVTSLSHMSATLLLQ